MNALDPQALEMATYPMDEWLRWERDHCAGHPSHVPRTGIFRYGPPRRVFVADCPLCVYGCQVAGCNCKAVAA